MEIRSPLVYPGGKRSALPQIIPLIPEGIEDWREPFFGGGSVTIGFLQSQKSNKVKNMIVGDLSPEVWAFWEGTKKYPQETVKLIKKWVETDMYLKFEWTPEKISNITEEEREAKLKLVTEQGQSLWNKLISLNCQELSLAERAARFFIINRISFSALGESGSMSKDRYMAFNLEWTDRIIEVSKMLANVNILNVSFEETMSNIDESKSFIFLDPPYIAQEKSGLYGKEGDTHKGFPHKELAKLCRNIKCKWLMTLDDSVKARKLYKGLEIMPFKITYTLAMRGAENSLDGEEIFISNYPIKPEKSFEALNSIL